MRRALVIAALFAATPAMAEMFYMSDPGLCDAPDGVTELLDTTFITARSIGNHYFECRWNENLWAELEANRGAEFTAKCENSTDAWTQVMKFYPQDESNLDFRLQYPVYLSVWFDAREMMPVKFYKCP